MKNSKMFMLIALFCMSIFGVGLGSNTSQAAEYTISADGNWVSGTCEESKDDYKLELPGPGKLIVSFESYASCDYYTCSVLDENKNTSSSYAYCGKSGSATDPSTDTMSVNVKGGIYYIHVGYFITGTWTGNYRIRASFESANVTETEPNDTFNSANVIGTGQMTAGFLAKDDTDDYYKFVLTEPSTVQFVINVNKNDIDAFYVYDNNRSEIMHEQYISSDTLEKYLVAGTYYLKIHGTDAPGAYSLCVNPLHKVSAINLKGSKVIMEKGKTYNLLAGILPDNVTNKTLQWTSNNSSVATVSPSGVVAAKSVGYATIGAKALDGSDISATATIIVKPGRATLKKLKLNRYSKRTIEVYWKTLGGSSVRYQVQYSKNKKFKKAKSGYIDGTACKINNASKKKKYYVRVRGYYEYAGERYYGTWSKVKSIRTKKR